MKLKLIPLSERSSICRCWFCRTNESVKYAARMVNTNPMSEKRFMTILVCNKCASRHSGDLVEYKEG